MISDERIRQVAAALAAVPTVVGVTLGGSRARGDYLPGSDVDLGVYYEDSVDITALTDLAHELTGDRVDVAGQGGWGPWVNGGAWLTVDGTAVDWILRDLARVREQSDRARLGEFGFHPQAGHPLGFLDISYAGELATARILADPRDRLVQLQAQLRDYPAALRTAMVDALWEAEFLMDAADKGAVRGDPVYVAACLSRAVLLSAHGVCARAGTWVTNEKGLVPLAGAQPGAPREFSARAAALLGTVGTSPAGLAATVAAARDLVREVRQGGQHGAQVRAGAAPARTPDDPEAGA